jgi:protein SCO1/2
MSTGCTTSCSAQGLLFATMAARRRAQPVAWLSISIDVLSDDPARLRAWQRRFGEQPPPMWQAAVPAMRDVNAINAFLRGTPARAGTHTNQVFVFDRQGRLAYRTGDDPAPDFLEQLLQAMA